MKIISGIAVLICMFGAGCAGDYEDALATAERVKEVERQLETEKNIVADAIERQALEAPSDNP